MEVSWKFIECFKKVFRMFCFVLLSHGSHLSYPSRGRACLSGSYAIWVRKADKEGQDAFYKNKLLQNFSVMQLSDILLLSFLEFPIISFTSFFWLSINQSALQPWSVNSNIQLKWWTQMTVMKKLKLMIFGVSLQLLMRITGARNKKELIFLRRKKVVK